MPPNNSMGSSRSMATMFAASVLVLCTACAGKQSAPVVASFADTGAQYCEFSKGHVETLKTVLKNNASTWSNARRASYERDLVASEKETAICCSDLEQCKRAFEAKKTEFDRENQLKNDPVKK